MIFKYFKGQIYLIIYLILRKLNLKHLVAYINLVMEFRVLQTFLTVESQVGGGKRN
jgi:hypothetical protein